MERGMVIGVVVVVILVIALGIYFYPSGEEPEPTPPSSNCAGQDEWYDFTDESTPNECCNGLDDVHSTDSISVADECYWTGTETGYPGGVCSDCGNGICEDVESVCGCAEDCVGNGKSTFDTIQQFCDEDYERYCSDLPEGMELDLCNLCE